MELFPTRAVALSIGAFQIHWYGIMYLLGFLVGAWLLPRIMKFRGLDLSAHDQESLILHVFLGVLLGGRFGFVLFYGGDYYVQHPLEIFAVWQGGMSSHGGFIGVILMLLLFCYRKKIPVLSLADIIVIPVAIGLALGRIGNLINGELYGTVTNVPWAMAFPDVVGLRHPTQIYAFFKDLLITALCLLHLSRSGSIALETKKHGITAVIFLLMYAFLRFIVEIYRDQPYGFTQLGPVMLSRGQLLTIPVFALGIGLFVFLKFRNGKPWLSATTNKADL